MDWWHEDPELLSATLYMLASGEEDPHAGTVSVPHEPTTVSRIEPSSVPASLLDSLSSSPSPPPSETSQQPKPRPRVVNVSRERRRDETRYLRAKVAELESQLAILQQRREQMLRPHLTETGEIRSVAAVWEELATRQVRERKRYELLNDKLKTMLAHQLRVAEDLMAAIRKAEEESKRQRDEADGIITLSRPRLAIDISGKVSEEDQLARLETTCAQWRDAFAWSPKFNDGASFRFFDIQLVQDNGDEAIVDMFSSSALPFSVEKVEEVFWRFYLEETAEDEGGTFAQDYESRGDTIIGMFRAQSTIDTHRATFDGKFVGKRFRSPENHMLVVSHMYSEPRCKSKLMEDVAIEEDFWVRIVDSNAVGGPALSHPLTLIQNVRRLHIRFDVLPPKGSSDRGHGNGTDGVMKQRQAGALTEFLMMQIEDEMKRGEQYIENMLLDDFGKMSLSSVRPESAQTMIV